MVHERAEALKTEGNTLFQEGQWRLAARKYSEAIKEDSRNAVYFANRAACQLKLSEYLDACADAKKAIEIDPNYAKAWSRLATAQCALCQWVLGIPSWKRALACFPEEVEMSEAEKRLAADFRKGLAAAEHLQEVATQVPVIIRKQGTKMPWQCASEIMGQIRNETTLSSGFIIFQAYEEFKRGVETMKGVKRSTVDNQMQWYGKPDALVDISNGLMRDPRVMHIDSEDWIDKLNDQIAFETNFFNAWYDGGPKVVIPEIPKRLKKNGWEDVRNALACQVRGWIICGILSMEFHRYSTATEYHSRALEVLRWANQTYSDVPIESRGCIFRPTFMRGVAFLQVAAIHADLASDTNSSIDLIDDLDDKCITLISDITTDPPSPLLAPSDPAFYCSFWVYPHAEALAIRGWCYIQRAKRASNSEDAMEAFSKAASYYNEASAMLPEDEEKVVLYYSASFQCSIAANKPWGDMKQTIRKMLSAGSKMMRIWENSNNKEGRDEKLEFCKKLFENGLEAERNGRITDQSVVKSKAFMGSDPFPSPVTIYV